MKFSFALLALTLSFVGCSSNSAAKKEGSEPEQGNANGSNTPQKNHDVSQKPSFAGAATQVNPQAFNGFNIWRYGDEKELLDYPKGWEQSAGADTSADDIFSVALDKYWSSNTFKPIGVPTEGVNVVGNVLEYPVRNGKQLKLKFSAKAEEEMNQYEAARYCKDLGLRLPTIRELFDYCDAGVEVISNFPHSIYPSTARCYEPVNTWYWSASVFSGKREYAWIFHAQQGYVNQFDRLSIYGRVRCVGSL